MRIRFTPQSGKRWWDVLYEDDRFIIATQPRPFITPMSDNDLYYTVVDTSGWNRTYNGVGPGIARSSLNSLGGMWPEKDFKPDSVARVVEALHEGSLELSNRRVRAVESIEREDA